MTGPPSTAKVPWIGCLASGRRESVHPAWWCAFSPREMIFRQLAPWVGLARKEVVGIPAGLQGRMRQGATRRNAVDECDQLDGTHPQTQLPSARLLPTECC